MPENSSESELLATGAEQHERFVREMRELDLAFERGKMNEWLDKRIADDRIAATADDGD